MQDERLAGKTAIVTGAAQRIGAALVQGLHSAGANVAIHFRNSAARANALCKKLNTARADSAMTIRADLSDAEQLATVVESAVAHFQRLDLLVNNASSFYPTPVETATDAQWQDLIGSNLRAPFFLSQAAAPHLRQTNGLIVNMIDIHARRPLPDHAIYCASKAGLAMLTAALSRELGPEVRVNGIAPGPVLWPEAGLDDAMKEEIIRNTALNRVGSTEDIVRFMLYLALDAEYVTGQILAIDGGRSVGW